MIINYFITSIVLGTADVPDIIECLYRIVLPSVFPQHFLPSFNCLISPQSLFSFFHCGLLLLAQFNEQKDRLELWLRKLFPTQRLFSSLYGWSKWLMWYFVRSPFLHQKYIIKFSGGLNKKKSLRMCALECYLPSDFHPSLWLVITKNICNIRALTSHWSVLVYWPPKNLGFELTTSRRESPSITLAIRLAQSVQITSGYFLRI